MQSGRRAAFCPHFTPRQWNRLTFGFVGDMNYKWAIRPDGDVYHLWRMSKPERQLMMLHRLDDAEALLWRAHDHAGIPTETLLDAVRFVAT